MIFIIGAVWGVLGFIIGLQVGGSMYRKLLNKSIDLNKEALDILTNTSDGLSKILENATKPVSASETNKPN